MPSLTSFPSSPSIGDLYSIGNVKWKYNGYAWDKQFHGHTGEQLISSISGATGAIKLCSGLTLSGQTMCINHTTGITIAALQITEGISLDENAHIYGTGGMRVGIEDGPNFKFDSPGGKVVLSGSEFLDVNQYIRHHNDTDTWIQFPNDEDQINLRTGGSFGLKLTNENLEILRGISANAGATIANNLHVGGAISFSDGSTQDTASRGPGGLKYIVTSTSFGVNPSAQGHATIVSNLSGAIDSFALFDTDLNGNDVSTIMDLMASNGGVIQFQNDQGTEFMFVGVAFSEISTYNLAFGSDRLTATNMTGFQIDTTPSLGDTMYITILPNLAQSVTTLGGSNVHNKNNIQVTDGLTVEGLANVGYLGIADDIPKSVTFEKGLLLGSSGITFSDGTGATTALRTDSYTGHIETASEKTYTIDPSVSTPRTITGYFIKTGSGTVTAALKNGASTVKSASAATTTGAQHTLNNTSVAAGATLSIVTSNNSSATDVVFSIDYTSTGTP